MWGYMHSSHFPKRSLTDVNIVLMKTGSYIVYRAQCKVKMRGPWFKKQEKTVLLKVLTCICFLQCLSRLVMGFICYLIQFYCFQ